MSTLTSGTGMDVLVGTIIPRMMIEMLTRNMYEAKQVINSITPTLNRAGILSASREKWKMESIGARERCDVTHTNRAAPECVLQTHRYLTVYALNQFDNRHLNHFYCFVCVFFLSSLVTTIETGILVWNLHKKSLKIEKEEIDFQ